MENLYLFCVRCHLGEKNTSQLKPEYRPDPAVSRRPQNR